MLSKSAAIAIAASTGPEEKPQALEDLVLAEGVDQEW